MSDQMFSTLLTIAGSLLGVIVGAVISSRAARHMERERLRQDRQEKLAALRRDAVAAALEWIGPMRRAETRASLLVMAAIHGEVEDERFLGDFPYLLGDLVKMEMSADKRAVLPEGAYARGTRVVRLLDELRVLGVRHGSEARAKNKPMAGFAECSANLDAIGAEIRQLETELLTAFRATFQ